jgi:hypothetical protein
MLLYGAAERCLAPGVLFIRHSLLECVNIVLLWGKGCTNAVPATNRLGWEVWGRPGVRPVGAAPVLFTGTLKAP